MVKIDNIEKNDNLITMDCYEEGNPDRAHHVVFDADTLEIMNQTEKNIYITQGIWRIYKILKEKACLPRETCSYWY